MYLINTEQREHLKLLRENTPEVAIEICKLALDFLNNGPNQNRLQTTASKLNTTTVGLQDAINALIMLQLNSIKTNASEEDFEVIEQLGFTKEHIQILWQFVTSKRDFTQNILDEVSIVEYRFRDLDWRLEGRVASRSLHNQSIPFITIKLHLECDGISEYKTPIVPTTDKKDENVIACPQRQRKVVLQTDPNNLLHIINILERALNEARTHRVRNVVKNL